MYPCLRFVHPIFDAARGATGLRVGTAGQIEVVSDHAAIRQSILLLLSTRPGERVMRPTYGCALDQLVFAPNDDTTAGLAIHYVRRALAHWEPRVEVRAVTAVREPEAPEVLVVNIEYTVRSSRHRDSMVYRLSLTEAG